MVRNDSSGIRNDAANQLASLLRFDPYRHTDAL